MTRILLSTIFQFKAPHFVQKAHNHLMFITCSCSTKCPYQNAAIWALGSSLSGKEARVLPVCLSALYFSCLLKFIEWWCSAQWHAVVHNRNEPVVWWICLIPFAAVCLWYGNTGPWLRSHGSWDDWTKLEMRKSPFRLNKRGCKHTVQRWNFNVNIVSVIL